MELTYRPVMTNDEYYLETVTKNPDDEDCFCWKCVRARKDKASLWYAIYGKGSGEYDRRLRNVHPSRIVRLSGGVCRICDDPLNDSVVHIDHEPPVIWLADNPTYAGPIVLHPTHASCNLQKGRKPLGDDWVRRTLAIERIPYCREDRPAPFRRTVRSVLLRILVASRGSVEIGEAIYLLRNEYGFVVSPSSGAVRRARRSLGVRTVRQKKRGGVRYWWVWEGPRESDACPYREGAVIAHQSALAVA